VANALAAAAIGVLQLGVAISLAALIFSGPLSQGSGRAAAGFVLGTTIVSAIVGATSKMRVTIAGAQDTAAIMVAAVSAAIVASPDIAETEMVSTVLVMIALAGLVTGLVFWFLGTYGLSSFVRFLPFPVVSGFTAGTGWLLLRGGLEVMHGGPIEFGELGELANWAELKFLVPGLGLALVMLIVVNTKRIPNTFVSVAILAGSIIFHMIARSMTSLESIEDQGWLIGPFDESQGWAPIGPSDFERTNWTVMFENSLLIVAVIAVSVIGMLLNLSGLEGEIDRDIDMNSEMKSAGVANLFAGVGGGLIGYTLIGDTSLARQLGARGRQVPLGIAGMGLVVFIFGADLIALVPRAVAGGVLSGLGITLLATWLTSSLPRMNMTDQLLSGLILLIIALFGVLPGVGAGVVIAAAVFIVKYSRTDPVRHIIDAAGRSTVDRDERDQSVLAASAQSILAFELQGYLFFGSTTQMRRQIEERVSESPTRFVILDFSRVTGIDSTAATGIKAIRAQLDTNDVAAVWSGLPTAISEELQRDALVLDNVHVDLDHAIAWCEDRLLDDLSAYGFSSDPQDTMVDVFDPELMDQLQLPRAVLVAGQTLIAAGATGTDMYFVESGRLTAWLETDGDEKPIRMRQVLPGAALGEIAFCTGAARTATVIADSDATIRVLTREHFSQIAAENPSAAIAVQKELLRRLSGRVSSTSAMVRDLLK